MNMRDPIQFDTASTETNAKVEINDVTAIDRLFNVIREFLLFALLDPIGLIQFTCTGRLALEPCLSLVNLVVFHMKRSKAQMWIGSCLCGSRGCGLRVF